jgi:hypothetical protein
VNHRNPTVKSAEVVQQFSQMFAHRISGSFILAALIH